MIHSKASCCLQYNLSTILQRDKEYGLLYRISQTSLDRRWPSNCQHSHNHSHNRADTATGMVTIHLQGRHQGCNHLQGRNASCNNKSMNTNNAAAAADNGGHISKHPESNQKHPESHQQASRITSVRRGTSLHCQSSGTRAQPGQAHAILIPGPALEP